jgi:hypothetical protein
MARIKYLVTKRGTIIRHKVKEKNIRLNYVQVGRVKGKPVYQKKRVKPAKEIKSKTYSFKRISKERKVAIKTKARTKLFRERQPPKEEKREQLVEVKGLVSGEYKIKSHPFHCEMLFYWCGQEGFDEKKLLESAYEVMIESLPEIDRITYVLITSEHFGPDYQRWGIESVNPVQSGINEQMEFEIFIPGAQSGRVLYNNSAWVKA